MDERKRIFSMIVIMISVSLISAGMSTYFLYCTALGEEMERLSAITHSQKRLIESVTHFETLNVNRSTGAVKMKTTDIVLHARKHHEGFGETGEFLFARRVGAEIEFLHKRRHETPGIGSRIPLNSSILAEPMRRALKGKSGTVVALDYRGERVMAAYDAIGSIDMGIVAKIDLKEVRKPFFHSAAAAGGLTILLVSVGACVLLNLGIPMARRLRSQNHQLERINLRLKEEIEEKRRALESTWESEKKFRNLFDSMRDAICVADPERRIVDINPAFVDIFGYRLEELKGKTTELLHENFEGFVNFGKALKSHGGAKNFMAAARLRKKNGEIFDAEISLNHIRNRKNQLVAYVSLIRDITRRLLAEKTVRVQLDELNQLYDTSPVGLCFVDTQLRYVKINKTLARINGRPAGEHIGKTVREMIPEIADQVEANYRKVIETGRPLADREIQGELPSEPGVKRIWLASYFPFRSQDGAIKGVNSVVSDVTHEREMDRMKTDFFTTAAHELRTPLTSIRGFSEILLTRGELEPEDRERFLRYIHDQSVNMGNIINDLLDISRIESGMDFHLKKKKHVIENLIEEVIVHFSRAGQNHEFEVVLPQNRTELWMDREKIRQVLNNLVGNASKYSPAGSKISVHGEPVKGFYRVAITDHGQGMTSEQIKKTFEKFYRVDTSDTALSGTGLGMSIVKYLVEAHGGKVMVESEWKLGTTVSFTLPVSH